jgi:hypothetical protein
MPKKIVIPLVVQNETPMPVVAAGLLFAGDEVEWVSGSREVTLKFPDNTIFGTTMIHMDESVTSMTLAVQAVPQEKQKKYTILDHGSEQEFPGAEERTQPVMIFGP